MEFPQRKPNRLKGYDYSQNGAYFVTIRAKDNAEIFGTVGAASCYPQLTSLGEIIENEIKIMSSIYQGVVIDRYVIMPNHVHMIIGIGVDVPRRYNAAPTVSQMINQWKRAISLKAGSSPWQKSFYDRIIRNEQDYSKIAEYIENNPRQWSEGRGD